MGFVFNELFIDKLSRMFNFINGVLQLIPQLIKIGDDDSGKLLYYGLSLN